MENISRVFQKQKRKKLHEEIELHNSFKIGFLLPLTGCRKVLGKMPVILIHYQWKKFQCHTFFPSQDTKQNVFLFSYLDS